MFFARKLELEQYNTRSQSSSTRNLESLCCLSIQESGPGREHEEDLVPFVRAFDVGSDPGIGLIFNKLTRSKWGLRILCWVCKELA